jgi:tryptophan synthase beta chain
MTQHTWSNPRVLFDKADLDEIYRHEDVHGNRWLFPEQVLEHWVSDDDIPIPDAVRDGYEALGRPTPLHRALKLEERLGTRCRIYLKREDVLPNGSFKITSALPQALFGAQEGRRHVYVETGAGQTGAAASLAASMAGMGCDVYMVRTSYDQKPLRRRLMEFYGARVHPSPSDGTALGRSLLDKGETAGSIAVATSEVFELIEGRPEAMNVAGSLLDFTLAYCSVLGDETRRQLRDLGVRADAVVGSVGGGSSFGGFAIPFLRDNDPPRLVATESTAVPTLSEGEYGFDHPDGEGKANPLKMLSLGYKFQPSPMHATGLRYHAASPLLSKLVVDGAVDVRAVDEAKAVEAAQLLALCEGIVVAPESAYAVKGLIDHATEHDGDAIVALVSGSGYLDLDAYGKVSESAGAEGAAGQVPS